MFSVVILTLNEERNLPRCLASIANCRDIVVLDSGSTDATAQIAAAAGARVVVRPFDDFAGQRNFADREIVFAHDWVFHLDADEQFTPDLFAECAGFAETRPPSVDGCFAAPKMYFRGRWIPHCTDFPAYQARFVHARRFNFVQAGHGQREAADMRMATLKSSYLHDLSADGEEALVQKHRRYARHEAHAFLAQRRSTRESSVRNDLFDGNPLVRRRALKRLSRRLPAIGPLRFVYQYILRRGFLDGKPGLAYCRLMSRYENWIAQEIRRGERDGS